MWFPQSIGFLQNIAALMTGVQGRIAIAILDDLLASGNVLGILDAVALRVDLGNQAAVIIPLWINSFLMH